MKHPNKILSLHIAMHICKEICATADTQQLMHKSTGAFCLHYLYFLISAYGKSQVSYSINKVILLSCM